MNVIVVVVHSFEIEINILDHEYECNFKIVIQNSQIIRKYPQKAIFNIMIINAFYFKGKYVIYNNLYLPQRNPTIVFKILRQILHAVHILLNCPDYCRGTLKQCLRCSCNRCFKFLKNSYCY